ncbi:galactoside alpha-(1,2)-fucosyltransferase 1-like [Haliotis rufescens]|uniref:galactoside alpha-(1,2)-fucosyltransferase 1-like n=1 Tax=Haliotis rufescens TaxID=6454 RepID=UPI00201ED4D6|nr:galactoside alpha-(1,2)-fucosyltransferase 1-like [Haliotis rufescens]
MKRRASDLQVTNDGRAQYRITHRWIENVTSDSQSPATSAQLLESQLRAEFRFRAYIDKQAKGLFKRYVESVTDVNRHVVGVHIRHGDYMYNRFKKLGYAVPSLQYYKRAMAYMKRKLGNVTFLVVGDDLPWAKVNLQGPDVVISEPHPAGIHLALLSRCGHMIQSTGTFSWWAGWFVSGHVVYFKDYPERGSWLDGRVVKDDYYLPHWVAL